MLSVRTSPTGAPARRAANAATASPTSQPSAVPPAATAALSATVSRTTCQRRAPASRSRRAGAAEVSPQRGRGEHGEGEEERRRLAADEQQPAAGDRARPLGLAQLLDRRRHVEGERGDLQLRPRPVDAGGKLVDLPQPRPPWRERPDPGVAAVRAGESRRGGEHVDALGEEERRGRRPVVADRALQSRRELGLGERVVGRRDEVPEEQARAQPRAADLDESQPLGVRDRAGAAQPQHLAAVEPARAREPAGEEDDVRRDAVDGADPGELPADRALAEEHEPLRLSGQPGERGAHASIERRATPGRPHPADRPAPGTLDRCRRPIAAAPPEPRASSRPGSARSRAGHARPAGDPARSPLPPSLNFFTSTLLPPCGDRQRVVRAPRRRLVGRRQVLVLV